MTFNSQLPFASLSIVTISYNQAGYLTQCVESVAAQPGAPIEHIIVDPGSTDGSRELLTALRVRFPNLKLIFQPDTGPAQGLNHGLSHVTCDTWMYLNADDELAPGARNAIGESRRSMPDADVYIANGWIIDPNGTPIAYVESDRFTRMRYACNVANVLQQGTFFNSHTINSNTIAFNEHNRISWDLEILFSAYALNMRFAYPDATIGYFRMQPESITQSAEYSRKWKADRKRLLRTWIPRSLRVLGRIWSTPARAYKKVRATLKRQSPFPGLSRL